MTNPPTLFDDSAAYPRSKTVEEWESEFQEGSDASLARWRAEQEEDEAKPVKRRLGEA